MVSSGSGRLSQIFATTTYRAPTAKAVADATASVGEKITERSDDARVVNSRAGVATKKTSRPRTNCPWLPRVPRRPRRYPTAMTRSEEHTSELQSLMRISYAVICLTTKTIRKCSIKRNKKINHDD